ncbi:MAG: efflux RND transporter periplasmic adaptor subunit [Clostridiales bacterium]|nr:efflux RND transporter periplasmic adaptor subunit [Clostridiales bacterium]
MKNKWIIGLILIVFVMSGCTATTEDIIAKEVYVPVEVMQAEEGSISKTLTFTGEISSEASVVVTPMLMSAEEALQVLVKVGDYVDKDQVMAVLSADNTSDQVESSRLQYELAKSSYDAQYESYLNAVESFEKIKLLYEAGAVSKSEYDGAKLRASDSQLSLLKDQLNQAKFAYNNSLGNLDDLNLKAPVSGIISEINISENNMVSSQNTITVLNLENLEVSFYIPEGKIGTVKPGMPVTISIPSINKTFDSVVEWINPQKDAGKNMYKGNLLLKNMDEEIYPGMKAFVDVKLSNDTTYLLPVDAIMFDEEYYVYVVNQEKPLRTIVEIGEDNGEKIEILSGLTGDEFIIVKGQNFVKEDSIVKVVRGQ